ncbi:MAG: tetratricopeptide repeat protein [Candidatus Omnitrophota bacterium]
MKRGPAIFLSAALIGIYAVPAHASARDDVRRGNLLYNNKEYKEAARKYEDALSEEGLSGMAHFNLADAHYQEKKFKSAIDNFNKAIASGQESLIARADYNIGNSLYRLGDAIKAKDAEKAKDYFESALRFYKRAMELDPSDRDAKFNYEFVQRHMTGFEMLPSEEKQDKEKEKEQEKQKNDNKDKQEDSRGGGSSKDDRSGGQDEGEGKEDKDQTAAEKQNTSGEERASRAEAKDSGAQKDGQSGSSPEEKKDESGQAPKEEKPQDKGGEKDKEEGGSGEGEKKEAEQAKKEQGEEGEDKGNPRPSDGEDAKESGEKEGGGLESYASPQRDEEREMSEEEAKMLIEGYRGEEVTGKVIKMRKKQVDLPEPSKNW